MLSTKESPITVDQLLARNYLGLVISISGTYVLGMILYADPFRFWQQALSELGTTRTLLGTPNLPAALVTAIGMLITAKMILNLASIYRHHQNLPYAKIKTWLLSTASAGAVIAIFPNNHFHFIHSVGSGMMIGPIFILELILIDETKLQIGPISPLLLTLLLSGAVVYYAAAFFFNAPVKQFAQKICVISLLFILTFIAVEKSPSRNVLTIITNSNLLAL